MDSGTHSNLQRLLNAALDLPPSERESFLDHACRDTPALLPEVKSLIDWAERTDGFLETPILRLADFDVAVAGDPLIGRLVGPWRIVDVIGRGGMGVVYRAERADAAFQRIVAVKVVGHADRAADVVDRFHRERETLAALDHPNIARLIDGGSTPQGQPYFVMEYVDGVRVDRYCDDNRLDVEARLALFRTICAAVQHAHQTLVVHRDLKPDNILVSRDGVPKLLDFGIARVLSDAATRDVDPLAAATWLMTPDYASPEQIGGGVVTTAADVYSLGVLLHVLVTGCAPYRLDAGAKEALSQQLATAAIARPSDTVLAHGTIEHAAARGTTRAALARQLRGDLDAIVLRALRRDVRSRYQSVEQLLDELDRFRHHYPVAARGERWPYLLRTFTRRHRLALAVATLVMTLLTAAAGSVLWQARVAADARERAERRFNDVRRLAQTFMFDVHDEIVDVPGTTRARGLVVRTASEYLESLAREASDDLALQRELAGAFVKVGDAQGHPTSANLGDTAAARASYERAIALSSAILRAVPNDVEAERTRAMAHRRLADVLAWSGESLEALPHCETSRQIFHRVAVHPQASVEDRLQAFIGELKLGDLLGNPNFPNLARHDEASSRYQIAGEGLHRLAAELPGDERVQRYLGIILERIGTMHEVRRDWSAAGAAYGQSFRIREALAAAAPLHTDVQRDLAIAFEKLGNVQLASGDATAAEESYRGALALFERLAAADTSNVIAARSAAISQQKVATTIAARGGRTEAVALLRAAVATHERLARADANNAQARCDAAAARETLGDTLATSESGHRPAATRACEHWQSSLRLTTTLRGAQMGCVSDDAVSRLRGKVTGCLDATSR